MSEVLIIGEPEIIEGFALTGADIEPENDPVRAQWLVEELLRLRDTGIVVITESLYEQIPEKVRTRAEASSRPLFVTLPRPTDRGSWGEREDHLSQIMRRTIGYRVKIRK